MRRALLVALALLGCEPEPFPVEPFPVEPQASLANEAPAALRATVSGHLMVVLGLPPGVREQILATPDLPAAARILIEAGTGEVSPETDEIPQSVLTLPSEVRRQILAEIDRLADPSLRKALRLLVEHGTAGYEP